MNAKVLSVLITQLVALILICPNVWADWGNVTVTDSKGDDLQVKHPSFGFGEKKVEYNDRLGDAVELKHGLFDINRETNVHVLGNSYEKRHGLLGGNSYKASTLLGDTVESKKTFLGLGPRKTNINLKGVSNLVDSLFERNQLPVPATNNLGANSLSQPASTLDARASGFMERGN